MMYRILPLALILGVLSACGSSADTAAPGAPTAGEQQALDDAAEMLESERLPASAVPPTQTANPAPAPAAS